MELWEKQEHEYKNGNLKRIKLENWSEMKLTKAFSFIFEIEIWKRQRKWNSEISEPVNENANLEWMKHEAETYLIQFLQ